MDDALSKKLDDLKTEYSKTKYNKATNKHLGILRRKIAEIKVEIEIKGRRHKGTGFFVKKAGDATVALLGFPSAGKSTLINAIANTMSKTASYAFTTTTILPGMMVYNGAHIQVFDMPGIIEDAHKGIGGGRSVLSAIKSADLITFVVDAGNVAQMDLLMKELYAMEIKVNARRPAVSIIELSPNHGIDIEVNKSNIPARDIELVLSEFKRYHSKIRISEKITIDELISAVSGKTEYMPGICALNKIDSCANWKDAAESIAKKWNIQVVPISATKGINIDNLKRAIYDNLGIMTIYLLPEKGMRKESFIIPLGFTVADAATKLHTELADEFKSAYVSGPSARFNHQKVGATHVLKDGDVITFIRSEKDENVQQH